MAVVLYEGVLYHLIRQAGQSAHIIGKISLKLVKYILLSILPHSYMLCDQFQHTVQFWWLASSVCGTASDLPNLECSHNQRKYFLYVHNVLSPNGVHTTL